MRTENVIDSVIWFVNVLLAFAIILFAFLFILFPKREKLQSKYGDQLVLEEVDATPTERPTMDQYRPCWKSLSSPPAPLVRTGSGIRLEKIYRVTAVKDDPADYSRRQVWLENLVSVKDETHIVGDSLEGGFKIVEIGKNYMIAERPDPSGDPERQRLECFVGEREDPAEKGAGAAGDFPAEQDKLDPNKYKVSVKERDYILENQDQLINEVTFRPVPGEGGKLRGIVLDAVEGSHMAKRGFQKGDVIRSVNGIAIDSSEAANALMANEQVRGATSLKVVIDRQGRTLTLQFDIR